MPKLTHLLLVDDDQTCNYLNQLLLKRLNVADNVLVALNGQEALEILHTQCAEPQASCSVLILLDVKMPVMDGFEFMEAFEQSTFAGRPDIIIVMLTTSLHPQDVERMQQLRIDGYLNKPLTREKVETIMQEHFATQLPLN